jgi:CheY-like chemotaxis protein
MPTATVLVANDEEDILRLLGDRLRSFGLDVHTARDGLECVELVDRIEPDLVLLDVWMPRMDGMAALAEIARGHPGLPVLMVSASADQVIQEDCLRHGASDYLVKPFEPTELKERVFRLLGGAP